MAETSISSVTSLLQLVVIALLCSSCVGLVCCTYPLVLVVLVLLLWFLLCAVLLFPLVFCCCSIFNQNTVSLKDLGTCSPLDLSWGRLKVWGAPFEKQRAA